MSAQQPIPIDQQRPQAICRGCFATWRARSPRPPIVWCWHSGHAARIDGEQWRVLECVSPAEVTIMRGRGLL